MLKLTFTRYDVNQAVFFKWDGHVNDCTFTATSIILINHSKAEIAKHVETIGLGELHWLLGIEIRCDHEKCAIYLSQHLYIDSILCHYNLQDLKPVSTPMETHIKLSTSQSPATTAQFAQMHDVQYHKAVRSLMYASLGTHPDILLPYKPSQVFPLSWDCSLGAVK